MGPHFFAKRSHCHQDIFGVFVTHDASQSKEWAFCFEKGLLILVFYEWLTNLLFVRSRLVWQNAANFAISEPGKFSWILYRKDRQWQTNRQTDGRTDRQTQLTSWCAWWGISWFPSQEWRCSTCRPVSASRRALRACLSPPAEPRLSAWSAGWTPVEGGGKEEEEMGESKGPTREKKG